MRLTWYCKKNPKTPKFCYRWVSFILFLKAVSVIWTELKSTSTEHLVSVIWFFVLLAHFLDPKDAQAWYYLGRYYMQRLNYSKAYESYQQAVYRDSRNSNFWCSIGVLYWEINQFRDALDAYTRAIRLNPYIPEIWFNLGTLYEACNNQIQDAIDAYNRAYELDNTYLAVEERLNILKRNLETGRNDGPLPPRPSDIDPQRYEDFLQSQANQQSNQQLYSISQQNPANSWGPPSSAAPPPPVHRGQPMHQPMPPQHAQHPPPPQHPPRRSPDQMKATPYSHPPPSYSNGSSGYGRPPPAPPVSVKRGSSPAPYGYDARAPTEPLHHQGYGPRHDEMSHRPPHLPPTQSYVSPRSHERELGGPGAAPYPPLPSRSPVSYNSRPRSPLPPAPISQHGPPPDVKPILDQGPPVSPGTSTSSHTQLAPIQSNRSPQSIPPVPRNDAAAYPPPPPSNEPSPGQKRWDERDYNRGSEPSRTSPHARSGEDRQEPPRHEPPPPALAPRQRSPLISPRTAEPPFSSVPPERKSPPGRMEVDEKGDRRSLSREHEAEKMHVEEDKRPEAEAPARMVEVDEDYDKEEEKPEEK